MRKQSEPKYKTGDRVNGFTIQAYLGLYGSKQRKTYLCICDCGNICNEEEYLLAKNIRLCCRECTMKKRSEKDILRLSKKYVGKTIGHYRILQCLEQRATDRSFFWRVQCLYCNRTIKVRTSDLKRLATKSCACEHHKIKPETCIIGISEEENHEPK